MSETLTPKNATEVLDAVRWAADSAVPVEVAGAGTKRAYGRPPQAATRLDLVGLTGIDNYEPNELVMSAGAGTPMAEIEAALAENRQQLAFEPADLGPLLGTTVGGGTVGGVVACNLTGPRRIKAGAARDHVLGFKAVSGRGETFKSGGRVVKNVTGFDLSKLIAGSFGTLAVMTEVTLKVLPRPEKTRTVLIMGADDRAATEAMGAALGSPFEVASAAHLPADAAARSAVSYVAGAGAPVTAIRVEGPGPSVDSRCVSLRQLLKRFGDIEELHSRNSGALWQEVRDAAYFAGETDSQVWRVSVPPASGARVAADILAARPGRAFYDWGGGLVWLALEPTDDAAHETVRRAVAPTGGHATLIRASDSVRAAVPVFQPQEAVLAALTKRIKEAFDPGGVLNPGRMTAGV